MTRFVFLGTSGAVPSATRDTTWLAFAAPEAAILVDCGGSPMQKLHRAGIEPETVAHVVLTHIHPDHAYGFPALVQNFHLLGRRAPLAVWSRPEHIGPLRELLGIFRIWERPGLFPLSLNAIDLQIGAPMCTLGPMAVTTAPNDHGRMPNFAVRVDVDGGRTSVVYSSDTVPCDAVVALARGAETLVHEATFPHRDRGRFGAHSTAAEAGEIAARAGVRRLILAHIEASYHDELDALADEARTRFGGVVEIARELEPYPL